MNERVDMDFKEATDQLTDLCATLDDVAVAVGRAPSSVRKARLAPDSSSYRRPPPGWESAIAKLARERALELTKLAEELEG